MEVMNSAGRRLSKARLSEGIAGITRLHAMIAAQLDPEADLDAQAGQVTIGIETDRGPWVQALIAAGYQVYAVNPLQASRYRERVSVSGAKSDTADAHLLADMVRTDSHQLRVVAGDTDLAEAVKVLTRTHKRLIWERTRHTLRLRSTLREYFPGTCQAFETVSGSCGVFVFGVVSMVEGQRLIQAALGGVGAMGRPRRKRSGCACQAASRTCWRLSRMSTHVPS